MVGDPLGATTHTDMLLRAKEMGVETQVTCLMDRLVLAWASKIQEYTVSMW